MILKQNKKFKFPKKMKYKDKFLITKFSKRQLERMTCPICVKFSDVLSNKGLHILHRDIVQCFDIQRNSSKKKMILSKGNQIDKIKDEIDQNQLKTELSKNLDNIEKSKVVEDETAKMLLKEMSNITKKLKTNPENQGDKTGAADEIDQNQLKTELNKNLVKKTSIEESNIEKGETLKGLQKEKQTTTEKFQTNPNERNRVKALVKEKFQATPEQRKPEIENVCLNEKLLTNPDKRKPEIDNVCLKEKLLTNPDKIKPKIENVCLEEKLQANLETLKSCLKVKEKNNETNLAMTLEVEKIGIKNEKAKKIKNETEPKISKLSLEKIDQKTQKVNFPIGVGKLQNRSKLQHVNTSVVEKPETETQKSDIILNDPQIFEKRKASGFERGLDGGTSNAYQPSSTNQNNLKRKLSNSEDNQRQIKFPKVTIKEEATNLKTEAKVVKSNFLENLVAEVFNYDIANKNQENISQNDEQNINQKDKQNINQKEEQNINQKDEQNINQNDDQNINQKDEQNINQNDEQNINRNLQSEERTNGEYELMTKDNETDLNSNQMIFYEQTVKGNDYNEAEQILNQTIEKEIAEGMLNQEQSQIGESNLDIQNIENSSSHQKSETNFQVHRSEFQQEIINNALDSSQPSNEFGENSFNIIGDGKTLSNQTIEDTSKQTNSQIIANENVFDQENNYLLHYQNMPSNQLLQNQFSILQVQNPSLQENITDATNVQNEFAEMQPVQIQNLSFQRNINKFYNLQDQNQSQFAQMQPLQIQNYSLHQENINEIQNFRAQTDEMELSHFHNQLAQMPALPIHNPALQENKNFQTQNSQMQSLTDSFQNPLNDVSNFQHQNVQMQLVPTQTPSSLQENISNCQNQNSERDPQNLGNPMSLLTTDSFQYNPQILNLFLERGAKQYPMTIKMERNQRTSSTMTQCTICRLQLKSGGLMRHMKTIHRVESSFKCLRCNEKFLFRNELHFHVDKVHPQYMFEFMRSYPEVIQQLLF
jgi:hypothetical protein